MLLFNYRKTEVCLTHQPTEELALVATVSKIMLLPLSLEVMHKFRCKGKKPYIFPDITTESISGHWGTARETLTNEELFITIYPDMSLPFF